MKTKFKILILLTFIFGIILGSSFIFISTTHAQSLPSQPTTFGPQTPSQQAVNPYTPPGSQQVAGAGLSNDSGASCFSVTSGVNLGVCFTNIVGWVAYLGLYLVSWLVAFAGLLLNTVISYTVLGMKARVDGLPIINDGWRIIRDVGNLIFIFILLYIAIATILGLLGGDTKRTIRNVIIIGLLVNFSLFFTQVLIDASNILSIAFYNNLVNANNGIHGLSDVFAQSLGITGVFDPSSFTRLFTGGNDNAFFKLFIIGVGGTIYLGAVALTFLYASLLFIIRFVVLIVLMILSPLAYFAAILPNTREYSRKWWNLLIGQLVFAPLYMLMIYLVAVLSTLLSRSSVPSGFINGLIASPSDTSATINSNLGTIITFIVIIVFINIAAIVATAVASNSGGFVGGMINRSKNMVMGFGRRAAGGTTAGLAGYTLRNTVGKKAYKDLEANEERWKEQIAKGGIGADVARLNLAVSRKAAGSSFDIRATDTAKAVVGNKFGQGAGKGGYQASVNTSANKRKTEARNLGSGDIFKYEDGRIETMTEIKAGLRDKALDELKKKGNLNPDSFALDGEINRLYGEEARKRNEDPKVKKVSRQELYTDTRLKNGIWYERLYTRFVHPISSTRRGVTEAYRGTYTGNVKAAKDLLKNAGKQKKKEGMAKNIRRRDALKRELNSLEDELSRRGLLDKVGKKDQEDALGQEQKDLIQRYKDKDNEYTRVDKDIRDAQEKEPKEGGEKKEENK